jgi:hypothetical protein
MLTGATGELGRSFARMFAGRRTWSVHDLHAWQVLAPLNDRYLPWSSSAMRPSGLTVTLNDICFYDRKRIVECGAGISTVFIGRLLKDRGGRLISLENDMRWAEYIARELEREGLEEWAEVRLAPLDDCAASDARWYSQGVAHQVISELLNIELLLVDGPAVGSGSDMPDRSRMARYPALPFFGPALSENCTVILDDIERRGEQQIAKCWEKESNIRFHRLLDPAGVAIGHPAGQTFIGV